MPSRRPPHANPASASEFQSTAADPRASGPTCAAHCVYVDGIEGDIARLLIAHPQPGQPDPASSSPAQSDDWREYRLPLHVLPPGLREGDWLNLTLQRVATPTSLMSAAPTLRRELGQDDDGGDFSL